MYGGVDIILSHGTRKLAVVAIHHLGKRPEQNVALLVVAIPEPVDLFLLVPVACQIGDLSGIDELSRIGNVKVVCLKII